MSPDRLSVRQQLVTIRNHLAGQITLDRDARHQMWVRVTACIADLDVDPAGEVDRLTKHLHDQKNASSTWSRGHPDYEYATVEIGRKSGEDPEERLKGDGWEPNGEGHDSWERFDYTEDHYFRRRKPE